MIENDEAATRALDKLDNRPGSKPPMEASQYPWDEQGSRLHFRRVIAGFVIGAGLLLAGGQPAYAHEDPDADYAEGTRGGYAEDASGEETGMTAESFIFPAFALETLEPLETTETAIVEEPEPEWKATLDEVVARVGELSMNGFGELMEFADERSGEQGKKFIGWANVNFDKVMGALFVVSAVATFWSARYWWRVRH